MISSREQVDTFATWVFNTFDTKWFERKTVLGTR